MEPKIFKRLPSGISNYERLVVDHYAYVDKTRFIEMLENETNPNHFFFRPRKFGKSLFLSVLTNYYSEPQNLLSELEILLFQQNNSGK